MKIKKYFLLENYYTRIIRVFKLIRIKKLEKQKFHSSEVQQIWKLKEDEITEESIRADFIYYVFGKTVDIKKKINWHRDQFSGFQYPNKRFDTIKASQWFNQEIELKYPWEVSKLYFAIDLAKKYIVTNDEIYYNVFKNNVVDWIKDNSFLKGVNWLSTMDVAIRAANIIVAINIFNKVFFDDKEFCKLLSKSLYQHGAYISNFPLIEKGGLTTNHTISEYTGLLFIALAIPTVPESEKWIRQSLNMLNKCMSEQVYDDGVDYEGSIPYHRLVLELFAYSTIIAKANNLSFPNTFYTKLFKMFEYSASYMDESGNAPQIGDNDSGRFLIFNMVENDFYKNEHNHSYLIALGEHLFDYKFKSNCNVKDSVILKYLPDIEKIDIESIGATPRKLDASCKFEIGGMYFLKNERFKLCVACAPNGQNGKGGHNHLDTGSFTLSIDGKPLIIDPGTYCYTPNKKIRDEFRSYVIHNVTYDLEEELYDVSTNGYWQLEKLYGHNLKHFENDSLDLEIKNIKNNNIKRRKIKIDKDQLIIIDSTNKIQRSRINFSKLISIQKIGDNFIDTNFLRIEFLGDVKFNLFDYEYSPFYGFKQEAKCLIVNSENQIKLKIIPK